MFHLSLSSLLTPAGISLFNYGLLAVGAYLAIALYLKRQKNYPYPPGPKGLPIIGNVFDIPQEEPWVAFRNLSRDICKFCCLFICSETVRGRIITARWLSTLASPIIGLNIMGTAVVVLNDFKTSIDLLEKRGALYSNRCVLESKSASYRGH